MPDGQFQKRPRQDSNLRHRLRRAVLYPLSYGGSEKCGFTLAARRDGPTIVNCSAPTSWCRYRHLVFVGGPSVLVVDDSDVIRSLIVLNLELDGLTVWQARDGQECLELVKGARPDLITLDVAMPRLDGFSTVEALRADPETQHIPIVMVSARAQGSDLARGQAVGVDAYVTKPFEPEDLVATVRSLITRTSAE